MPKNASDLKLESALKIHDTELGAVAVNFHAAPPEATAEPVPSSSLAAAAMEPDIPTA